MLQGAIIGGIVGLVFVAVMMIARKKGGAVPRFSQFVDCLGNTEQMLTKIDGFLQAQGYFPLEYNGEAGVYKSGTGVVTAPKYIKVCGDKDGILVQAFVVLYGTESGLSGFTASIPKKSCMKVVSQVIEMIQNG